MSRPDLSIVIPVYNNAKTLDPLIERVAAACRSTDRSFEIILVDDGSRDDSWARIEASTEPTVRGLKLSRNFGQHAALKAGFAEARGQHIIMMDADLEEDPVEIPRILDRITNGYDICYTAYPEARNKSGRVTSRLFHRLVSRLSKIENTPNIATMRGFNRVVLDAILRHGERRPVYGPLIVGLGFDFTMIDVDMPDKKGLESSYSFTKRLRLALDYLIGYTNLPAMFFMAASGVAFLATLIYTAVIIVQYVFTEQQLPPGLSLVMVVMLLLFSMLFFGIGILGMYLHRLLEESLDRPLYLIAKYSSHAGDTAADISHEGFSNVRRD